MILVSLVGTFVIYKDLKILMIFNYILGSLMLHKFVDTNVIPFFFFGQNGCSFWGREKLKKQSLQLRLRMGKKSHMKMPQLHWRELSISIQPCKLVMVIGQLKMLAHCSSFHPWWVSSLNSIIVIDTSWNTNYFRIGLVWYMCLNTCFLYIFINFFTHTYFQKIQTILL